MDRIMRTVLRDAEGYYEEKKSRFIANVFRVNTEDDVLGYLQEIRKIHYEARHHCFAYVLGRDRLKKRCSDDGEPQKTAGAPILQVLDGEDVTDTLIVVTRYFGGTLLGTGGLTRAYSKAAKDGLTNAMPADVRAAERLRISVSYEDHNRIRRFLDERTILPAEAEYGERVTLHVLIPSGGCDDGCEDSPSESEQFRRTLSDLTQGRAGIEAEGCVLYAEAEGKAVLI
ncbi:MAG: YigZ family protein [Lachnospiraceae bacterium]|nr:YigZ family protein [Lachnospiraceae bacterium]